MKPFMSEISFSQDEEQLLSSILAASTSGAGLSAQRFRADNFAKVELLDRLESQGYLKTVEGRYSVSVIGIRHVRSQEAQYILSDMDQIYHLLRTHYINRLSESLFVDDLSGLLSLPLDRCSSLLLRMAEVPIWCQRYALTSSDDRHFVGMSEGILKHETFGGLLTEVEKWWHKSPIGAEAIPLPLMDKSPTTASPVPQNTNTSDVIAIPSEAWPAIRACLSEFSFYDIKKISGLSGLNLPEVAHLIQKSTGKGPSASKGELMSAIDKQFGEMPSAKQLRFLSIVIEEMLRQKEDVQEQLSEYLNRLGWAYVGGSVVPMELMSPADLEVLPEESHHDFVKAAKRFRDGDLTGAVSAACGAVDSVTSSIYRDKGLGDPTKVSFQDRCVAALRSVGRSEELKQRLKSIGWLEQDVVQLTKNFEGSLNQGAFVMQTLRSKMGDVHGSKPILKPLVFDCIRWAQLIVAALTTPKNE